MAQAFREDKFDSSGEDRQIQLSERDFMELLLRLISSVGETKKLKNECDQLQHQLNQTYQTGNDGIQLAVDFEDNQTNKNTSKTAVLPANKNKTPNNTDSGMGSGSDVSSSAPRPRKSEQQSTTVPDCGFMAPVPNVFGPSASAFETCENIDVGSVASNGKFKQIKKSNSAEIELECDGAVGSSSLRPPVDDVFGKQMPYIGSPQILQRAASSRQDDQTSDKRKAEMKKTGSHDSYFTIESKNDRYLPLQQSSKPLLGQRKSSYPAVSSRNSVKTLDKTDSLMISCIPQVASKTILDGVSRELRRVRNEYNRLEQREEKMKKEIYHLRGELNELNIKLEEKEKAIEDERIKKIDDHEAELKSMYRQLQSVHEEFENEKKLHASVKKILKDERQRFARDEEQWIKQVEALKRKCQAQNRLVSANKP